MTASRKVCSMHRRSDAKKYAAASAATDATAAGHTAAGNTAAGHTDALLLDTPPASATAGTIAGALAMTDSPTNDNFAMAIGGGWSA